MLFLRLSEEEREILISGAKFCLLLFFFKALLIFWSGKRALAVLLHEYHRNDVPSKSLLQELEGQVVEIHDFGIFDRA